MPPHRRIPPVRGFFDGGTEGVGTGVPEKVCVVALPKKEKA